VILRMVFGYGYLGCDAVLFDKEEPVASIFGGHTEMEVTTYTSSIIP